MNTLSSLLNWIGNTIGANPNTLVTASKKIVGSINEAVGANPNTLTTSAKNLVGAVNELDGDIATVNGELTTLNTKIDGTIERKQLTITATTTTGTLKTITCYSSGNIVWLSVAVTNASSVSAGNNIYQGTLSSALPRPYAFVTGGGYYDEHAMAASLSDARVLTVRNASSSAVNIGSSSQTNISLMYITQD